VTQQRSLQLMPILNLCFNLSSALLFINVIHYDSTFSHEIDEVGVGDGLWNVSSST